MPSTETPAFVRLAQSLDVRLHEAHGNNLGHAEFLELLLQDELLVRADRQLARRGEHRDVLFLGPPGVGKSHLVQALGYQVLKQGGYVLYRSVFDVVRDFLHGEVFAGHDKILAKYLKPDPLIIDDMGLKQLPKRSGECLFQIILRRYERVPP